MTRKYTAGLDRVWTAEDEARSTAMTMRIQEKDRARLEANNPVCGHAGCGAAVGHSCDDEGQTCPDCRKTICWNCARDVSHGKGCIVPGPFIENRF